MNAPQSRMCNHLPPNNSLKLTRRAGRQVHLVAPAIKT
jgi:hypothetical protein